MYCEHDSEKFFSERTSETRKYGKFHYHCIPNIWVQISFGDWTYRHQVFICLNIEPSEYEYWQFWFLNLHIIKPSSIGKSGDAPNRRSPGTTSRKPGCVVETPSSWKRATTAAGPKMNIWSVSSNQIQLKGKFYFIMVAWSNSTLQAIGQHANIT